MYLLLGKRKKKKKKKKEEKKKKKMACIKNTNLIATRELVLQYKGINCYDVAIHITVLAPFLGQPF